MPDNDMDDERIIVAMPVAGSLPDCVVTGSSRAECSACGTEVWIAPSSRIMMRMLPDGTCRVLCMGCACEAITADPEPEFSTTVEEAFRLLTSD